MVGANLEGVLIVSLAQLHREYERIMHADLHNADRDKALANLMDEIKRDFGVPLIRDPEWERCNRSVVALYRKVSESRSPL